MAELPQGESTSAAGLDIKSVSAAKVSTALNMQTNKPDLQMSCPCPHEKLSEATAQWLQHVFG